MKSRRMTIMYCARANRDTTTTATKTRARKRKRKRKRSERQNGTVSAPRGAKTFDPLTG